MQQEILLAAVCCLCLLLTLHPPVLLQRAAQRMTDPFQRAFLPDEWRDSRIVLVKLDERTFTGRKKRWTAFGEDLALLVRKLRANGAAVTALDVSLGYDEGGTASRLFAELEACPAAVVAVRVPSRKLSATAFVHSRLERMTAADRKLLKGFIDFLPRPEDGAVIRYAPVAARLEDGSLLPSFALQCAAALLRASWRLDEEKGELVLEPARREDETRGAKTARPVVIPLEKGMRFRLAWPSRGGPPSCSALDVLEDRLPGEMFRNKIVVVSPTDPLFHDLHPTPLGILPGGVVHTVAIADILDGRALKPPPAWFPPLLCVSLMLAGIAAGRRLGAGALAISCVTGTAALAAASGWAPVRLGIYYPFPYPALNLLVPAVSCRLASMWAASRESKVVRRLFEEFVSPQVLRKIMEQTDELRLEGETCEATVLFADIRGFTSLSDALDAAQVFELLDVYHSEMTRIITSEGGRLDKFIGDGIMAVFGVPVSLGDDALRAVRAAVRMQEGLRAVNAVLAERGLPSLRIGTGVASGPVRAGVLGSRGKKEYAVIGDTVNTASRIESLTKEVGRPVLADERTVRLARESLARGVGLEEEPLEFVEMGEYALRGKKELVRLFAVESGRAERAAGRSEAVGGGHAGEEATGEEDGVNECRRPSAERRDPSGGGSGESSRRS